MIKLIAIDLDGTLLKSDGTISQVNIESLHYAHSKGVKIVICTGRPYLSMKQFIEEIGLISEDDYIITFNGGQIQKARTGEVLFKRTLSQADMLKWYELTNVLLLPLNIIDAEFIYEPPFYPQGYPSIYLDERKGVITKTVDYHAFKPQHEFSKFVISVNKDYLDKQITKIPQEMKEDYSVFKSRDDLLEVVAKGVTKGAILAAWIPSLGLSPQEVMTLGDQENDLSMIEFAGLGIAMANAVESVKAAAQDITDSNDNDGVAKAIYQYIK